MQLIKRLEEIAELLDEDDANQLIRDKVSELMDDIAPTLHKEQSGKVLGWSYELTGEGPNCKTFSDSVKRIVANSKKQCCAGCRSPLGEAGGCTNAACDGTAVYGVADVEAVKPNE